MTDNTLQFSIAIDARTIASDLSEIQSQFQQTTSTVASQWTEASSTITASLTKMADGAEQAAGRTKEQVEKASGAVGLLSDILGIQVPESIQKMLASSELAGPALEAAFTPLAAIALVGVLQQVIGKARELYDRYVSLESVKTQWETVNESLIQSDRQVIGQMQQDYVDYVRVTQGQARALQAEIAGAGIQSINVFDQLAAMAKDRTGKEFKDLSAGLKADMEQLRSFPAYELDDKIEMIAGALDRAQKNAARLMDTKGVDSNDVKVAEAEFGVLNRIDGVLKDIRQEREERAKALNAEATQALAQKAEEAARQRAASFAKELEDELTAQKQTHLVSIEEELHFWQSKLAAAAKYPDVYRNIQQTIAGIDQQIFTQRAAAAQQAAQSQEESNQRATDAILNDVKAQNDAIIAKGKELLDAQAALYKGDIAAAKVDEQTKSQLAEAALARGKITKQQEIAIIAAAKQQEIQLEIKAEQAIEALYDNEPRKVAEIEAKITQLRAQARLAEATADNQQAKASESRWQKQLQDWQDINKAMQDSYLQMLNSMNSALISFVTSGKFNWQQMASSMISDILKVGLQWVESQIMMKLFGTQAGADTARSNVLSSAASGAAAAGASVAAIPVIGWSMVEAVSTATYVMLSAYQAGIKQLNVGTWNVPSAMLAFLHPGEMVMPAFESGMFRNLAKNISSGAQGPNGASPLHVHFHVNAIDGADAAAFIQKNANNITSVLYKQMRKKGFQVG